MGKGRKKGKGKKGKDDDWPADDESNSVGGKIAANPPPDVEQAKRNKRKAELKAKRKARRQGKAGPAAATTAVEEEDEGLDPAHEEEAAPVKSSFGFLGDDGNEEDEDNDGDDGVVADDGEGDDDTEVASPPRASTFGALDDDEEEEDEEEDAAPAKQSAFAAFDDDDDDEDDGRAADQDDTNVEEAADDAAVEEDAVEPVSIGEESNDGGGNAPAAEAAAAEPVVEGVKALTEKQLKTIAKLEKRLEKKGALDDEDSRKLEKLLKKKAKYAKASRKAAKALRKAAGEDRVERLGSNGASDAESSPVAESTPEVVSVEVEAAGRGEADDENGDDGKQKKKLSNKERRRLREVEEKRARDEEFSKLGGATSFAVSSTVNKDDATWQNATDINIPQFTIQAFGRTLFRDAELRITAGRRYGLVGPNGMGKTTLLKQIANGELAIPPRIDCLYVEQEVTADDTPAVEMVLRADVRRTEMLEEEAALMKRMDEGDDSVELRDRLQEVSNELEAIGAAAAEAKALSLLHGLGFTEKMQRAPTKSFSGGWRMRVSLARALFVAPTLMLLDEPTNHLDLNAVIWLDDYLQRWKQTLLIVSHDQDFLDSVCTDVIHLENQKLVYYRGNYSTFKGLHVKHREQMQKAWEQQEKAIRAAKRSGKNKKKAEEEAKRKNKREGGGAKKGKGKSKVDTGMESTGTAELIARPKDYQVEFIFPQPTELNPPVIQIKEAAFAYGEPGANPLLFEDVSFGIDQQSRITIVGPNGVGKSTLLKMITKDVEPTEGEVNHNRYMRLAWYHQHFVDILPMDKTPVEFLLSKYGDENYQSVRNRLGKFGLPGSAHTIPMAKLSGGQKSRVVFTSIFFQRPHLIILDEPTNNLDIESIDALIEAINDYEGGIIVVTHDARLIQECEMVLWVVENKNVAEERGGYDAYKNELLAAARKKEEENEARIKARAEQRALDRAKKVDEMNARRKARLEREKAAAGA